MQKGKNALKYSLAQCWRLAGRLVSRSAIRAPILTYHSVNPDPGEHHFAVSPQAFEDHLAFLTAHYEVVPLQRIVDAVRSGGVLPAGAVALTFDDGYVDNFTSAWPLLKKYRCPATIFIVTAFIDNKIQLIPASPWRAMSWDQIRQMHGDGLITFGAHGDTHAPLGSITPDLMMEEIKRSKDRLGTELGCKATLFAYPNGQPSDFDERTMEFVKRAGFDAAFSTFWCTHHSAEDLFRMNRVAIDGLDNLDTLRLKVEGAYDYIYYIHQAKALRVRLTRGLSHH